MCGYVCVHPQVREHFAAILEEGHEAIESVRIVRDPDSQVGKGFGFLLLKVRETESERERRAGRQAVLMLPHRGCVS